MVRRVSESVNYRVRSFVAVRRNQRRWREEGPHRGGRRVLLIESRVPHIALGAGYPRSNLIVDELATLGYEVTLYPLLASVESRRHAHRDVSQRVDIVLNYGWPRLESFLEERGSLYDCTFVTRPHNMALVAPFLERSGCRGLVYDCEALSPLRLARLRELRGEPIDTVDLSSLLMNELAPAHRSRCISAVSAEERQHIERVMAQPVYELGYACESRPTPMSFAGRRGFLFVGPLVDSPDSPNTDAVTWFLDEVLPLLRRSMGERAEVSIVGSCDDGVRRRLARPGVTFLGPAAGLLRAYDRARVFVAPTRFAAGLPLKVFEAAAHGLPIVSTTMIANQVGWGAGMDLAVGGNAADFADRCVSLHDDPVLWRGMREQALSRIRNDCSRARFSAQLQRVLAEVVDRP